MFEQEKELVTINRVKASVKDIKVSGKGIVLNLENVKLTGDQIRDVSALVGGMVYVDLEERLPERKTVTEDNPNQLELLSDEEVSAELNLEQ
jgi:hypothetical protein